MRIFWGSHRRQHIMGTPHPGTTMQGLKVLSILYRDASELGTRELYSIYCTHVLPYLRYCVILWDITYKSKLKAVTTLEKIVLKTARQSHTRPDFYKLNVLHIDDIVSVNITSFMHKVFYKGLPQRIQSKFLLNNTIHKYGTRGEKNFMIKLCKTKRRSFNVIIKRPKHWNNLLTYLKKCINARTFKAKYKRILIDR